MIPRLPLGHDPFGPELKAEGLEAEWRFRVIYEGNYPLSMEMSFLYALETNASALYKIARKFYQLKRKRPRDTSRWPTFADSKRHKNSTD
jgi:hypothetical protein